MKMKRRKKREEGKNDGIVSLALYTYKRTRSLQYKQIE
jgi:hypothetical protein